MITTHNSKIFYIYEKHCSQIGTIVPILLFAQHIRYCFATKRNDHAYCTICTVSTEQFAQYNTYMRPVKPWDLLNKDNWTMEEVRAKRLEICEGCENFNAIRQCKLCHCFMDAKTMLENAYCPIRKW